LIHHREGDSGFPVAQKQTTMIARKRSSEYT